MSEKVALIECKLPPGGFTLPDDLDRLYEVHYGPYYLIEGGDRGIWVVGLGNVPYGTNVIQRRDYCVTEGGAFIDRFRSLHDISEWLRLLRAEDVSVVSVEPDIEQALTGVAV